MFIGSFLFLKCSLPAFAGVDALLDKHRSALPSRLTSSDPQRYNISSECCTPRHGALGDGGERCQQRFGNLVLVFRPGDGLTKVPLTFWLKLEVGRTSPKGPSGVVFL